MCSATGDALLCRQRLHIGSCQRLSHFLGLALSPFDAMLLEKNRQPAVLGSESLDFGLPCPRVTHHPSRVACPRRALGPSRMLPPIGDDS